MREGRINRYAVGLLPAEQRDPGQTHQDPISLRTAAHAPLCEAAAFTFIRITICLYQTPASLDSPPHSHKALHPPLILSQAAIARQITFFNP
ncbi:hypothetical protein NQZ68_017958 [Dissostichus eleginoides]|nr:hypothetical protein NQZ68_017958 [Dissostichus eleginoides]